MEVTIKLLDKLSKNGPDVFFIFRFNNQLTIRCLSKEFDEGMVGELHWER